MKKRLLLLVGMIGVSVTLMACGGPSEEKIAQAQQKYSELAELNNEVVEAHKEVKDNSLDEALEGLQESVNALKEYNLSELKDEEVDLIIETMDVLIEKYQTYQSSIAEIKDKEDAAVIIDVPLTITNLSDFEIQEMYLYEKGATDKGQNILETTKSFSVDETLMGLIIEKDAESTPWILSTKTADGNEYETEIDVTAYGQEEVALSLVHLLESDTMVLRGDSEEETTEETEEATTEEAVSEEAAGAN